MSVRIPTIKNIKTAIEIYYGKYDLCRGDIINLFGGIGSAKATKLKQCAEEYMREKGRMRRNARTVDTELAFECWGIDIKSLERRYKKLVELGFME